MTVVAWCEVHEKVITKRGVRKPSTEIRFFWRQKKLQIVLRFS